ncbi:MAG: hypothetical protein R3C49_20075 [Planctomycetaceae bacterium]
MDVCFFRRISLVAAALLAISGCLYPGGYYGYGNRFAQPMYAPPQMINQAAPGTLYIPESNAPAYEPGSTYQPGSTFQEDPTDDFRKSQDNNQFFQRDDTDGVPKPRGTDSDLGVQYSPSADGAIGLPRSSSIQPVSAMSTPMEYGFDTDGYSWLRGQLQFDPGRKEWIIIYSPAARDRFGGQLTLSGAAEVLASLQHGDLVDIHGHVHQTATDAGGQPVYHIESMQKIVM